MPITITEALADIKTTAKRIESKRAFILSYIGRPDGIKDPLEKDGGSVEAIRREEQAIGDLERRIVAMRSGIRRANDATLVEVLGSQRTISDWLAWRRDVAPRRREHLAKLRVALANIRDNSKRQGFGVLKPGDTAQQPQDVVINIDEASLAPEIERTRPDAR